MIYNIRNTDPRRRWRTLLLLVLLGVAAPGTLSACYVEDPRGPEGPVPLEQRLEGADQVVFGAVMRVDSAFGTNVHGDNLIYSTVNLQVQDNLKGRARPGLSFEMEGGTVGDLTLEVSDMPRLEPGQHGVFALRLDQRAILVPNHRGLGLILTPADYDLTPVRRALEVVQ